MTCSPLRRFKNPRRSPLESRSLGQLPHLLSSSPSVFPLHTPLESHSLTRRARADGRKSGRRAMRCPSASFNAAPESTRLEIPHCARCVPAGHPHAAAAAAATTTSARQSFRPSGALRIQLLCHSRSLEPMCCCCCRRCCAASLDAPPTSRLLGTSPEPRGRPAELITQRDPRYCQSPNLISNPDPQSRRPCWRTSCSRVSPPLPLNARHATATVHRLWLRAADGQMVPSVSIKQSSREDVCCCYYFFSISLSRALSLSMGLVPKKLTRE